MFYVFIGTAIDLTRALFLPKVLISGTILFKSDITDFPVEIDIYFFKAAIFRPADLEFSG